MDTNIHPIFQQILAPYMPETKTKAMNLRESLQNIITELGTVNFSSHTQMKDAIQNSIELAEQALLSIDTERVQPKDILPVLKENLEAMKHAKEMGWKDVLTNQDPFDCVIETYEDMIEIYKSRQDTRGDWTKCRCDNQFHWCFIHNKWGRVEGEREQEKRK